MRVRNESADEQTLGGVMFYPYEEKEIDYKGDVEKPFIKARAKKRKVVKKVRRKGRSKKK